ncbi:hypothetical protein M6B38_332230 [Iris pallida]|uniref:Uncharacterized protein n=1 Tax=Iris pallida TaxID=29817 RepID=A0AAX6H323_IRIPA|nr:hypothetical protein M6B38_332230 [Iris pallida]
MLLSSIFFLSLPSHSSFHQNPSSSPPPREPPLLMPLNRTSCLEDSSPFASSTTILFPLPCQTLTPMPPPPLPPLPPPSSFHPL